MEEKEEVLLLSVVVASAESVFDYRSTKAGCASFPVTAVLLHRRERLQDGRVRGLDGSLRRHGLEVSGSPHQPR